VIQVSSHYWALLDILACRSRLATNIEISSRSKMLWLSILETLCPKYRIERSKLLFIEFTISGSKGFHVLFSLNQGQMRWSEMIYWIVRGDGVKIKNMIWRWSSKIRKKRWYVLEIDWSKGWLTLMENGKVFSFQLRNDTIYIYWLLNIVGYL